MLRTVAILVLLALPALAACTNRQQAYPDESPEQLWTAMKAAAREPTYRDWKVLENSVSVFEPEKRIEVYRELRRDVVAPGSPPLREDQTWRFTITLEVPPPPKAPEVTFVSRSAGVPAHADYEADRFYTDVRSLLDGLPLGGAARVPTTVVTPSAGLPPPISVPPSEAQPLPPASRPVELPE